MLNQVAVEAIYSATYLENYLDSVENLPNDLQRHISRMRQLDVDFQAILRDIEHYSDVIQRGPEAQESQVDSGDEKPSGSGLTTSSGGNAGHWRKRLLQKVQSALISSLEIGDEKLQLVQTVQDVIENKSRQLETDCKALEFSKDRESVECAKDNNTTNTREASSATGGNSGNTGERTKRARRARPDDRDSPVPAPPVNVGVSQRKTSNAANATAASSVAKKKKRRSGRGNEREKERSASPQEMPIDPDEPTYCLCDQVSFGEMIGCDNDLCPIEWFHFSCVQLTTKPKGKWYCPRCRGDRPTVMKPKAQFLKELERYNKEKEEKA